MEQLKRSFQNGFDDILNEFIRKTRPRCALKNPDRHITSDEISTATDYVNRGQKAAMKHIWNVVRARHDPRHSIWPYNGVIRGLVGDEAHDDHTRLDYLERVRRSGRLSDNGIIRAVRPGDYFIIDDDRAARLDWSTKYDRKLPVLDGEVVIFLETFDYDDRYPKQTIRGGNKGQQSTKHTYYLVQACGGRVGVVWTGRLTTPWFAKGERYPNCFKKGLPPLFGNVKCKCDCSHCDLWKGRCRLPGDIFFRKRWLWQ